MIWIEQNQETTSVSLLCMFCVHLNLRCNFHALKPRGSTKRTNQQTKVVSEGISLSHSQGESLRRERLNVFDTENLKCYQTLIFLGLWGRFMFFQCCLKRRKFIYITIIFPEIYSNLKKLDFKWPSTSSIFIILDYTTQNDPFVKVAQINRKTQTQKLTPGQTPLQQ